MEFLYKTLYLYDTKDPKSVLRTAPSEKEGPEWTAGNCRNFTQKEFDLLIHCLGDEVLKYYDKSIQETKRGWCIVEGDIRNKIILGCLANDIDLKVIMWEGQ